MALTEAQLIADGVIVNADINASATIAGDKITPDFGSQNIATTGTATAAALIPSGATVPTNGVYLPSANNLAISTNGTGRLFVNASGYVAVGNSNPGAPFDVIASRGSLARFQESASPYNGLRIETDSTGVTLKSNSGTGYLALNTGNSERLRITSDGKLGLGTSSVSNKLVVNVGTAATDGIYLYGTGGSTPTIYFGHDGSHGADATISSNPSTGHFQIVPRGGYDTVFPSGRVGIGTTPSQLLHLSSTGFPTFRVTDADNGTYFDITNSDGDIILKADEGNAFANSAIRFMVDSGEKLRITNTGALGLSGTNYGSSGQVLTSQGSGAAPQWADAGGAANYDEFTSSGTWTKPAGVTNVYVELISGGGGGGSGRKAYTNAARGGGGGGGSGTFVWKAFKAADLPSSVSVTVGAGGTGASSQSSINTSGLNGGSGGESIFGSFLRTGFWDNGGPGGSTGIASTPTPDNGGVLNANSARGGWGDTSNGVAGYGSWLLGGGGGGAGAPGNNTTARTGGSGGYGYWVATSGVGAGTSAASGTGAGGGGGSYVEYQNGNPGGNGGFPGGGGGGGAGCDATANFSSGAGGNGASGVVRIWSW